MTHITILGSGRVASALAAGFTKAGHVVSIGTREAAAAEAKWAGLTVLFGSPTDAVRAAEIIVNATPGDSSVARFAALRTELAGKILIDVANATTRGEEGMPAGLLYLQSSLAEELQTALPETRVVKTLNTMLYTVMANPASLKADATVFLSGDDKAAKDIVRGLLGDLGWAAAQIEDLGGIESARGVEPLLLLVPAIIRNHGFAPFAFALVR